MTIPSSNEGTGAGRREKRMTFVETDTNPAPAGGTVVWVEGKNGAAIRTAVWPNSDSGPDSECGTVFLMPGKGEYIEKYFEVTGELLERGFSVVSLDWRGQGLSQREVDHPTKAYISDFDYFLDDFDAVFAAHSKNLSGPWIGLAHSMGGNIALRVVGEHRVPFDAMVITAPMTGLNVPPLWEKSVGAVAQTAIGLKKGHAFVPGAATQDPLAEKFEGNTVTSDPQRHARTLAIATALPEIALGGATYGWIHESLRSIAKVVKPEFGRGIRIPMLIIAASEDTLIDNVSNRYVGVNIPGAEFYMIEGAMHEILMDKDVYREQFWRYFDAFIDKLPAQTA